jgi:hypothetical protein
MNMLLSIPQVAEAVRVKYLCVTTSEYRLFSAFFCPPTGISAPAAAQIQGILVNLGYGIYMDTRFKCLYGFDSC